MTNTRLKLSLSTSSVIEGLIRDITLAQAKSAFGGAATNATDLDDLFQQSFASELATAVELRTVPPGWLERHQVLLPDTIDLDSEETIQAHLERMVNTVRDQRAIDAILCRIALPCPNTKKIEYFNPIRDLKTLARSLERARHKDGPFVDALLRGYLGDCAKALADETILLPVETARKFLIDLSILWGLHDLQIIACRLFQRTMWPTAGWFERGRLKPRTFDGFLSKTNTLRNHLETILTELGSPDTASESLKETPQHKAKMKSLTSYAQQSGLFGMAKAYADKVGSHPNSNTESPQELSEEIHQYFVNSAKNGISLIDRINTFANHNYHSRDSHILKLRDPKKLQSSSFHDGMRPEVALTYAIFSFVYLINALPEQLSNFSENQGAAPFLDEPVRSQKYSKIKCDIEELIYAYRSVYLLDANLMPKEARSSMLPQLSTNAEFKRDEIRDFLTKNQTRYLEEDPYFRNGPLPRESTKLNIAKNMIGDAKKILEREKAISGVNKNLNLLNLSALDPRLSIALPWRFSCTRDNAPSPDL